MGAGVWGAGAAGRRHLQQQPVVVRPLLQPASHRRKHVQHQRLVAAGAHQLRVHEPRERLPQTDAVTPGAGTHDVVHEHAEAASAHGVAAQVQLRPLQTLLRGDALHVKEQPETVRLRELVVNFGF